MIDMKWKDMNGNEHVIADKILLSNQQPNCKYLLPCGICVLTSSLETCYLLRDPKSSGSEDK